MKKRQLLLLLLLMGALVFTLPTADAAREQNLLLVVDGKLAEAEHMKPIIVEDRTLVPIRLVSETLHYDVSWNQEAKEVVVENANQVLRLVIGENKADLDGEELALDVPAQLIEDRTYVPLRFIAEVFDREVEYDANNQTVIVGVFPRVEAEEGTVLYENDSVGFTLNIPKEIFDELMFKEYEGSVTVYHEPTRVSPYGGGVLFGIGRENSVNMLQIIPATLLDYEDGEYIVATFPSDVQFGDEESQAFYKKFYDEHVDDILKTFVKTEYKPKVDIDVVVYEDGVLSFTIKNLSDTTVTFGNGIQLFSQADGATEELPMKEHVVFLDVLNELKPGEVKREEYSLVDMYDGFDVEEGQYYASYEFKKTFTVGDEEVDRYGWFDVYIPPEE